MNVLCRECEDEADMQGGQQALSVGDGRSGQGASSGLGRHSYFRARKLQRIAL